MSEPTTTPHPEDHGESEEHGSFVGGEFGHSDNAEDDRLSEQPPVPTDPADPADPAGGPDQPADVEGITTEPSPGDRNEPV